MAAAQPSLGWPLKPPDPTNSGPTNASGGSRPSFKDKLLNWRTGVNPYNARDGFQLAEDDIRVEQKPEGPSFQFSDRFKSHIACPWVCSVIVRVLGRKFSYRVICSKIAYLWKPQGGFQVIDLDNEYFLVRFEKREDYCKALSEGPWVIQGFYLTVQTWVAGFDVGKVPNKAIVWVQIPEMPVEWYRQDILSMISAQIDRWFKVKYEDIPDFCYDCGKIGHIKEHCPEKRGGQPTTPTAFDVVMQEVTRDSGMVSNAGQATGSSAHPVAPLAPNTEGSSKFGPWMKVTRQPRQAYRRGTESRGASDGGVGSSSKNRTGNPFDIGSATALLHEVHRDVLGPSVSGTKVTSTPLVFQSPMDLIPTSGAGKKQAKGEMRSKIAAKGVQSSKQVVDPARVALVDKEVEFPGVRAETIARTFTYPKGTPVHIRPMVAQSSSDTESVENMTLGEIDRTGLNSKRKFVPPLVKLRTDGLILEAGIPKQHRKANAPMEDDKLAPDPSTNTAMAAEPPPHSTLVTAAEPSQEPEAMSIEMGPPPQ
ncbi:hypothetical protein Tsubulata_009248 [Turnera subulata]|uniref:CCHC-type domain-containing protein n=1 Tax=Turnera subulata TaxID=218843 RepID=A0A9Q0FZG6_9ROSI|nr:hypothetical protein Tsubulata_009248 [Turnera subulata]